MSVVFPLVVVWFVVPAVASCDDIIVTILSVASVLL